MIHLAKLHVVLATSKTHTLRTVLRLCFVGITSLIASGPAFSATICADNGHYYEFVQTANTLSWIAADAEAVNKGGYLATVTSAEEQACIFATPGRLSGAWWAGGRDIVEGTWRWVTGPEGAEDAGAGRQFWQGGPSGNTTLPDNYANWFPVGHPNTPGGEPNNSGGEDYMSWNTGASGNFWNDVGLTNSAIKGYVIEYDSNPVADGDGDGVNDDDDLCASTIAGDPVDNNGCSDEQVDGDGDGFCDAGAPSGGPSGCTGTDNCPTEPNPGQENLDGDALGDVCDPDIDGDTVGNDLDNCPAIANPGQTDSNGDGFGDACVPATSTVKKGATIGPGAVIGANVNINQNVSIHANARIGDGTTVNRNSMIGAEVVIGENVTIGQGVVIEDVFDVGDNPTIIGDGVIISRGVYIVAGAMIDDGAFIGRDSVICDAHVESNADIGRNNIVQTNATVSFGGGNPPPAPNPAACL